MIPPHTAVRAGAASLLLLATTALGCAYYPTPTSDKFGFVNPSGGQVKQLEKRAPFDLDCDPPLLTYKILNDKMVGVEGCERRATYLAVPGTGWVMNNAQ